MNHATPRNCVRLATHMRTQQVHATPRRLDEMREEKNKQAVVPVQGARA